MLAYEPFLINVAMCVFLCWEFGTSIKVGMCSHVNYVELIFTWLPFHIQILIAFRCQKVMQGFGVIRIKTIFRMGCACLWVCEPLGKSACISFPVSVSASIFRASVFCAKH